MTETRSRVQTETIDVPRADQWTLHHVLLDRLEREAARETPSPLPPELVEANRAFETLDAGDRTFTTPQLHAIRTVVGEYVHSPAWEDEREALERLHRRLGASLDRRPDRTAPDGNQ